MLYNPLEQVTKSSFREFGESGYVDFVLQRLEWPDGKPHYEAFGWERLPPLDNDTVQAFFLMK